MSKQLLIYENVTALNAETHSNWFVEPRKDLSYAKDLNSLPLLATEFLLAGREYPIAFSKVGENIQPLVLLGLRSEENLYLNESNEWSAKYIPAFLRRYPFVFGRSEDGKTFTLYIDESFSGFNQKKKGEALFDEGKPSQYVANVLSFLQKFQIEHAKTQAFCRKLDELGLFASHNAIWTAPDGEKTALTGLFFINRKKLQALEPSVLAGMVGSGEMELIYAHLSSLNNFNEIRDKMDLTAVAETAPPVPKKKRKTAKK